MKKWHLFRQCFYLVLAIILISGCGLSFTVKDPVPSNVGYSAQNIPPTVLTIVDERTGIDAIFIPAQIGVGNKMQETSLLKLENIADPIAYFAAHLEKELNNRQIPVKCVVAKNPSAGMTLIIKRYQIASIRATGFSPWETMHVFSATLIAGSQNKIIKSYFYNGKVPVWSMNEILEPCFNIPISIMIKDIASKINQAAFHLQSSDQKVKTFTADINTKIAANDFTDFWKVLELGYTNNPAAVEPLKRYARMGDEFFKSCAISSIGTLGATQEVAFLKKCYADAAASFNDRYLAVKALGDLATPEALKTIETIKRDPLYEREGGLRYAVDLYLQ